MRSLLQSGEEVAGLDLSLGDVLLEPSSLSEAQISLLVDREGHVKLGVDSSVAILKVLVQLQELVVFTTHFIFNILLF